MRGYGCYVVAKAKMLVDAGIETTDTNQFNPDILYEWELANGYIVNMYAQDHAEPAIYASRKGKTLNYEGIITWFDQAKIWDNINSGKYTILCIPADNSVGTHYVYVNNGASKELGRIRVFNSYDSSYAPGTTDLGTNTVYQILTYSTPDSQPQPPVPTPTILDLGSDFYATIYYPNGGKLVRAAGGDGSTYTNVEINGGYYATVDSTDPKDIWHFTRQSNGSYKIVNEWCGWCLDLSGGIAGPEKNIGTWHEDHGGNPERWYITNAPGSDRWYNLVSAVEYPQYTMDVHNGGTSNGANVQIYYRQEGNTAQQFNILKKSDYYKPSRPAAPTFRRISAAPAQTTVFWNSVPVVGTCDSREYALNIYNKTTGRYVVSGRRTASTSFTANLPAGDYRAEISAVNTKYQNYASGYTTRDFTVEAEVFFRVSTSSTPGGTTGGDGSYLAGNQATVTASPQSGYHFVRWAEDGVTVSTSARYRFTVGKDRLLTAVFEQDVPLEPEETDAPVRIVPTNIQADSVVNYEGYGSLVIDGDCGTDADGEYTVYAPAQIALIDREGAFLFAYRDDPVGDGGDDTARFQYSGGVVSLTLGTPYTVGGIPQYYHPDGSKTFPLETTDREYTDENGVEHHDWTSWTGGPMRDGYAVVIQKLYSSWTNGWAGGSSSDGDNRTLIIDKNGTVTCELPKEYNETTSGGGANLWHFSTQMSLGWCGEGLFAFYSHTVDPDDWSFASEALGYMDPNGKTAIDLKGQGYIDAYPFHEGLAAVKNQDGKIGFIDKTGTLVIPCAYDNAGSFSDGLCNVSIGDRWGYIDRTGQAVIPLAYDNAYGSGGGLAAVVKDGKCGLVDYSNNAVVPFEYDDISSYEGGAAYGVKNDRVYLITEYVPDAPDAPGAVETISSGVKFVPFSCTLHNSAAGYEIQNGRLPHGLELDGATGEISGVPLERGVFEFTVGQADAHSYQLIIQDNTNSVVQQQPKDYPITQYVGTFSASSDGFLMTEYRDEVLVIDGPYDEFQRLLIDGVEMTRDEAYTARSGSTILDIYADSFENLGEGTHTIAAEFLDSGNVIKQAAQNYTVTIARPDEHPSGIPDSIPDSIPWDFYDPPVYHIDLPDHITGGSVTVTPARAGEGQRITIATKADPGYELASLTAADSRGNELELANKGDGKYTFVMPGSAVTVEAVFAEISAPPTTPETPTTPTISFIDVAPDAYYYDALTWAVGKGIATGTSITTFSPDDPCTRAQAVTFLWRAAGSPAPQTGATNPFLDVQPGSYCYDAVRWAMEQGITSGTSATAFSPDTACTRGQIVTFLYRYEKSPEVSGSHRFTDVASNAYYTNAVLWAVTEGVAVGDSATTFHPDAVCTRGQIVTFLYRNMA